MHFPYSNKPLINCPLCDYITPWKNSLKNHAKQVHEDVDVDEVMKLIPKPEFIKQQSGHPGKPNDGTCPICNELIGKIGICLKNK